MGGPTAEAPPKMSASVRQMPKGSLLQRPKRAVIDITPKAKEQIQSLMESEGLSPAAKALRLGVRTRGCNGMAYTLDWQDRNTKVGPMDEVVNVEPDGLQLIIDSRALLHVIGSTMDYEKNQLAEEFVFLNPNATGICGCGQSFSTE